MAVLSLLAVDGFLNDVVVQGWRSRLRVEFWYPVFGDLADARHTWICAGIVRSRFLVKRTLHLMMEVDKPITTIRQVNSG